jgi:hypothetical protein
MIEKMMSNSFQKINPKQSTPQSMTERPNGVPILWYDTGSIFDVDITEGDDLILEKGQLFLLWCLDNVEGDWTWAVDHLNVFEDRNINGKMIDQRRVILILTESKKSAMLLKLSKIGIQNLKDIEFVDDRRVSRTFRRY